MGTGKRSRPAGTKAAHAPITLADLAQKLGVSQTTISRALRDKAGMSPETRGMIRKAAEHYGYVPNKAGATLSTGRTFAIGYIVARNQRGFPDVLQTDVMRGMVDELARHGYSLAVYSEEFFAARDIALLDAVQELRVDGLVMTLEHSDPVPVPARPSRLPMVIVNRRLEGVAADYVLADEEGGARLAVERLIGQGHRRIAYIAGPSDHWALARREEGYSAALTGAGIAADPALIRHDPDFSWQGGHAACARLLDERPDCTAIFCGSDILAFGAYKCLAERGLAVPRDIAVASFDDVYYASVATPALTSVRKPRRAMGEQAARLMLERLDGRGEPRDVLLPVDLVVRESSEAGPVAPK